MISKNDQCGRRILKFPAVRPCDSVSPATFLDSLINLSHSICNYNSKLFSSNKKNARKSIRLIEILQFFFEEIRDRGINLSDSIILSLSELHCTFQKVQFLLSDCTQDGSRLWILMKSERVLSQFQVLIRTISTALDVLPLDSIEISIEVREAVQLVTKQARNLRFEVDPDDKSALKDVLSILGRFENRIVPDPIDLIRVLDYLGIRSWGECNKEIKFLESEIDLEYVTVDKRDLSLLSSLRGFMCYTRCVLFHVIDNVTIRKSNGQYTREVIKFLNIDDFRCPISLELMTDPVTLSTGHTYDRSSILKWFKSGGPTCPKTGERLSSTDMIPNLALKRLILQYCFDNGIPVADHGGPKRDITRTIVAHSVAAEESMKMVSDFLASKLESGTIEARNKAAVEIRLLSKTSIFNRSCLVDSNTIPHLLYMLTSSDSLAQENAMAALLNLSKHSESKRTIVENGGLGLIIEVLKGGLKMEARQNAAGTLFYLASVEEYRVLIGGIPDAIPALMDLIRVGTTRGQKNALVAIFGLLMNSKNHFRVLELGLVPLLVNHLTSIENEDLVVDSLAILATLAEKPEGTFAILRTQALNIVVGVLGSNSSRAGTEYCVSLLLALCINGGRDVVSLLVKNRSLMGPLYSLLAEGTSRASKKASSIIQILHEFHEKRSSGLVTRAIPQERIVHVW